MNNKLDRVKRSEALSEASKRLLDARTLILNAAGDNVIDQLLLSEPADDNLDNVAKSLIKIAEDISELNCKLAIIHQDI